MQPIRPPICKDGGFEQLQVFIEPKGTHLLPVDKWKEEFLLEMQNQSVPVVQIADDNNYKIWGLHFFNREERQKEFGSDMDRLTAYAEEI